MDLPPFQVFLEANRAVVYRFLAATVGPVEADDCFQETFLSALRAYPRLHDGRNLRGWVLTIATRKAVDAARARSTRPRPVPDVGELAGADPTERPDRKDPLWDAVRKLPVRQRAAVVHRFVLDRSYPEVAEAMGSSVETARANVSQGLKQLRREAEGWKGSG